MTEISKDVSYTRVYIKKKMLNNASTQGNFENERVQVFDLFKQTVEFGESNSALLIGPRGVGKTCLVNNVIAKLEAKKKFTVNVILVRLHGLIHTDDRLALKSITSQLNLDNAVDGKVFGSFAENLAFLLACLRTGDREKSKSALFILEEFDLFCSHHNQTLLYNLFDISQSAQAPICVFGITCRLDVIELLEKRVKSRFSHRQYFLFPGETKNSELTNIEERLQNVELTLSIPNNSNVKISSTFLKSWNTNIKCLMKLKKFQQLMQRLLDIDLTDTVLNNILFVIISSLNEDKTNITLEDFEQQMDLLEADENIYTIQDLSVLELCLLISMKHHVEIYDNQPMNFEMIFSRYLKFVNSSSNIANVQRPVVMKAFEHIHNLELISIISTGAGKLQKEYQMFKLMVSPQQITDAIKKTSGLPTNVTQWAVSSIV